MSLGMKLEKKMSSFSFLEGTYYDVTVSKQKATYDA
jgi:hypothetical protein